MAQSSFPFENVDTTETQFSQMFRTLNAGVNGTPAGTELKVTAGTGLQVSVALGQAMVRGHFYNSTAAELLTVSTANPTNPRIDTVVLRLDPVANSIVLAVVAGTAAASPVAPALTQTDAGVYEFPLANVAVAAGAGTVGTITDRRTFMGARLQKTAGAASRDLLFPSPKQGDVVWRDDTGSLETYYDLVSVGNPGGRDVAGWYADSRQAGLVPIRPATVTVVTGSGSANALGQVSFTGASSVSFDGVFTSKYKNYRLVMEFHSMSAASVSPGFRVRNAGVDFSASNYHRMAQSVTDTGASVASYNANATNLTLFTAGSGLNIGATTLDIINPNVSGYRKAIQYSSTGFNGTAITGWFGAGAINNTSTYDGFTIFMQGGNCSGVISIYGYGE